MSEISQALDDAEHANVGGILHDAEDTTIISDAAGPKVRRKMDPRTRRNLMIVGGIFFAFLIVTLLATCGKKEVVPQSQFVQAGVGTGPGVVGREDRDAALAQEAARVDQAHAANRATSGITRQVGDPEIDMTPPVGPPNKGPVDAAPGFQPPMQGPTVVQAAPALPQQMNQPQGQAAPVVDPRREKAIDDQIAVLMRAWGVEGAPQDRGDYVLKLKGGAASSQAAAGQQAAATPVATTTRDPIVVKAYYPYATTLKATIDTDAPGVVRGVISSGPLTGSTVIGTATRVDTGVRILFNQALVNDIPIKISAVGIDEKSSQDIVMGDYNGKYTQRFVLPIIADTIRAYTQAKAQTGNTVVLTSVPAVGADGSQGLGSAGAVQTPAPSTTQALNAGIASASNTVASQLANQQAAPQVTVAMNSTLGIMFLEPITQSQIPQSQAPSDGATATPVGRPSLPQARQTLGQ